MCKFDVVVCILVVLLIAIILGPALWFSHMRLECVKDNKHRQAADVQVICGRP